MKALTVDAYDLLHEGSLALAKVEAAGMRIDVDRLDRAIEKAGGLIQTKTARLKEDDVWRQWRRRFGENASLGSRHQLGTLLFEVLGFKSHATTEKSGKAKVDEEQLEKVDLPFVKDYLDLEKLKKLRSTYLVGIRREVVDGYLRPSFNLHLVITHRSSSDTPNFQNIPIRDVRMGRIIRSCFIPRDDHVLVEIDYAALEFRIAACFWRDEAMIAYASDASLDIHRDMASECYGVPPDEVTKQARFYAKNQFVFPTLYGSWHRNTAPHLWNAMVQNKLTDTSGVPLQRRLAEQGITQRNYEDHVADVETQFARRFPYWAKRKEQWWDNYLRTGRFRLMTGFEMTGVFSRNDLMNYPIQGPAFHILLWSLIRLVNWTKNKHTRVVGQIHDSIVADVHVSELDNYLVKAKQVMTRDVRDAWNWIVTPLEIEAEMAENNWFEKKVVMV